MARKESPEQKEIVGRVMHEFKHGALQRGQGGKVKNPRQAIAIALSEAGVSNQKSPQQNEQAFKQTRKREGRGKTGRGKTGRGKTGRARAEGGTTRAELYAQAKRENVQGRSKMSKAELQRALDSKRH